MQATPLKTILLMLMAFASVASAKTVDEWTFFSGAHLGMTMREFIDYYDPISDTSIGYGHSPEGQKCVDFRSYGSSVPYHDWRVLVHYRESDGVIVSIEYWNAIGKFSKEMIRHLMKLNKGYPDLITHLYDDGSDTELAVTTPAQEKLEDFHHTDEN